MYNENNAEYQVEGNVKLHGTVIISGAKNAVLPIMAASLLSDDKTALMNVPQVGDVFTLKSILEKTGARISLRTNGEMLVDTSGINNSEMPEESKKMRASILVAGPLLARFGELIITKPGGCAIGKRPIDWHLQGLLALGYEVEEIGDDRIKVHGYKPKGARIKLPFPSVGATENIMSAASLIEGTTIIENAAREPEVMDLARFLISMGAKIQGAGSYRIRIKGVKELQGTSHTIIPDRIEAATYLIASAITHGEVVVSSVESAHLTQLIRVLKEVGLNLDVNKDENSVSISKKVNRRLNSVKVTTAPYPGFSTDIQPLLMPLFLLANGTSTITETVFRERFRHTEELNKMGAVIRVHGNVALIKGVEKLHGTKVSATDLRAGAALILSGLVASGLTRVCNAHHIDRGYEGIEKKLGSLGADIKRVENTYTLAQEKEIPAFTSN